MAVSKINVSFESNVQKVWEIVTSLKNYGWRSDLSRIDILNEKQFVEYTKAGYPTNFTVTFMKPFVKTYLKKQQAQYVEDLKKALL